MKSPVYLGGRKWHSLIFEEGSLMSKKYLYPVIILLVALLSFGLTGCGNLSNDLEDVKSEMFEMVIEEISSKPIDLLNLRSSRLNVTLSEDIQEGTLIFTSDSDFTPIPAKVEFRNGSAVIDEIITYAEDKNLYITIFSSEGEQVSSLSLGLSRVNPVLVSDMDVPMDAQDTGGNFSITSTRLGFFLAPGFDGYEFTKFISALKFQQKSFDERTLIVAHMVDNDTTSYLVDTMIKKKYSNFADFRGDYNYENLRRCAENTSYFYYFEGIEEVGEYDDTISTSVPALLPKIDDVSVTPGGVQIEFGSAVTAAQAGPYAFCVTGPDEYPGVYKGTASFTVGADDEVATATVVPEIVQPGTYYMAGEYFDFEADLEVVSVEAINATTVLMEFSKEIEPDKVRQKWFWVGDDEISKSDNPKSVKLNEDHKEILVTLENPIVYNGEQWKVWIDVRKGRFEQGLGVNHGSFYHETDIDGIPETHPQIERVDVISETVIHVTFERNITGTGVVLTNYELVDLDDEENETTVAGVAFGQNVDFLNDDQVVITAAAANFYQDNHEYELTIKKESIVDDFGNENENDAIKYKFFAVRDSDRPVAVSVTYVANKARDEIHAIVQFDQAIQLVGAQGDVVVDIFIKDRDPDAEDTDYYGDLDVYDTNITQTGLNALAMEKGFSIAPNEIVVADVQKARNIEIGNLAMRHDREYSIRIPKNTVEQSVFPYSKNLVTTMRWNNGLDITPPQIEEVILNSSQSITVLFDERVKYQNERVEVDSFIDPNYTTTAIVVDVEMIDEDDEGYATEARLIPRRESHFVTSDEPFTVTAITFAAAAFVDAFGNESEFESNITETAVTDNAKPVITQAYTQTISQIAIYFTEPITRSSIAIADTIYVNGIGYEYDPVGVTTPPAWTITGAAVGLPDQVIVITSQGKFESTNSVASLAEYLTPFMSIHALDDAFSLLSATDLMGVVVIPKDTVKDLADPANNNDLLYVVTTTDPQD